MEKLRGTGHHYIRCLKPNQTLKPGDWDNEFMLKQLAYSGTPTPTLTPTPNPNPNLNSHHTNPDSDIDH